MIIGVLIALLISQQLFWMINSQRLINKLMCRNFFEYKQAEQAFEPKPPKLVEPEPEEDLGALDGMGGF